MLKKLLCTLMFCAGTFFAGSTMAAGGAFDTPETHLVELLDTITNGLSMESISAIQELGECREKALAAKYKLGTVLTDVMVSKDRRDPRVKEAAARALGKLFQTETVTATDILDRIIKIINAKEEDTTIRKACVEALVQMFRLDQWDANKPLHRRIAETMKDILGNNKIDDTIKAVALSVAVQINAPEAVKAVREGVKSPNAEYRLLVLQAAMKLLGTDKTGTFPAQEFLLDLATNLDASKADADEIILILRLVKTLTRKPFNGDLTHVAAKIVKLIKDFSTPEKSSPDVVLGCGRALLDHKAKYAEAVAALLGTLEALPNDSAMRRIVVGILNDYMCSAESLQADSVRNMVNALLTVLRTDKDSKAREEAIFALGITPKFIARDEIVDEFLKILKEENDENLWKSCKNSYERMTGRSLKLDPKAEQAKKIESIDAERKWLETNLKKFRPAV